MAINFIKDLSQLITGGIGIVDDELVYKDSEGNVKGAGGFDTVEEIPESLDPGQIVFVTETGSLWVGASDDYFPGLDAGTPWPVKGYKEFYGRYVQTGTNDPELITDVRNINEIGEITFVRNGTGRYDMTPPADVENLFYDFPVIGFDAEDDFQAHIFMSLIGGNFRLHTFANKSLDDNVLNNSFLSRGYPILLREYPPQPE